MTVAITPPPLYRLVQNEDMPPSSLTREEVIDRLMDVFRRLAYDGASLAEFSKATGLGKSSLYHYFPGGKEDMGRAVLERATTWLEDVAKLSLDGKGTPEERLRRMLKAINEFYQGGQKACILGNLVLGSGRPLFQRELRDAFRLWIDKLSELLIEAGIPAREARRRAEDAVVEIQGALIVSAGLDQPGPFQRLLRRLPDELLAAA
jgi:TetR/AcrR family transcriptional repressor of lmrAB and yxaGH operons